MDYVYAILEMIAGVGAFLIGCKFLSENMEKLANKRIRSLFAKTSKNKAVGVGIGTATTAIVQSSALTIVMVVGFVNSGIMTLFQATTVIMGANIGTTVTAQIAALGSFSVSKFAISLAGVGIFMSMLSKKPKVRNVGNVIGGLGLVFVGLMIMSNAMDVVIESQTVKDLFLSLKNPFLLFALGIIVTALVQSSSAITAIIITMVASGAVIGNGGNAVLYIILGTNIGTCVTAILSSLDANTNAKRASLIHLLFNVFGSMIFFIILLVFRDFNKNTLESWFSSPGAQIAMFHTFFNVSCTILFIPFVDVFVNISKRIIKDKNVENSELSFLDKRFLTTPIIAIDGAVKQSMIMLDKSLSSLGEGLNGFIVMDESKAEEIIRRNKEIYEMSNKITNYLIEISSHDVTLIDEKYVSVLHSTNGSIVRISELADNLLKYTHRSIVEELVFSSHVKEQLEVMFKNILKLSKIAETIMMEKDFSLLAEADDLEDTIDNMRKDLIKDHIERLNKGECRAENSSVFINLVCNLERVGDHLSFIAHSMDKI